MNHRILIVAIAGIAGLAACAHLQGGQGLHAHMMRHHAAAGSMSLQGGDEMAAWRADPHVRQLFDLSASAIHAGMSEPEVAAYEAKAYAIFRDFGAAKGVGADAMQDHLKAIPRQVVGIAHDDPTVLKNFDAFRDALFGPA